MSDVGYRPLGFESDLANPNFAGALNPDSLLHVEFYWAQPLDKNKTEDKAIETGVWKPILQEKQIYIRIQKPGDQTSVIETPKRPDHERRFPEKWLYFQIQEGLIDAGANQPGWKIEEWGVLQEDEIHKLKFNRFYTVEQIAGANDSQVQGLGIGGLGLRERAKQAVRERARQDIAAELNAKDKEIADMKERMAKLEALVMQKPQELPAAPIPEQPHQKRKYTRRVKEVTA